jgi:DNA-binding MarR family transcriptional regulator
MNANKKTTPSKKSERVQNCTSFNLRKASRAVTQLFDEALKPCGLYSTQFTLLNAIYLSDSATITKLSQALIMDRTTLTRNLNPLQKNGWIEVVPGEDRRTKTLSITKAGKQVLKEATKYWETVQAQVVKSLGKKQWEELLDKLDLVVAKLSPY